MQYVHSLHIIQASYTGYDIYWLCTKVVQFMYITQIIQNKLLLSHLCLVAQCTFSLNKFQHFFPTTNHPTKATHRSSLPELYNYTSHASYAIHAGDIVNAKSCIRKTHYKLCTLQSMHELCNMQVMKVMKVMQFNKSSLFSKSSNSCCLCKS